VVFEAGGGEDSSVWREVEPAVRERYGVRTMVYDRAGLGRSPRSPAPYRIDGEADALRRELDRHGIGAPVVLVAHSYGGFVTTIVAGTDPRLGHRDFVAASPHRRAVFAYGSGHHVMRDRPDIVLDAVG
jgi:pimeloyl-ACP methyl ester carboxylesterase